MCIRDREQALRTKGVKANVDKVEGEDGLCRLCGKFPETVRHIVSSCGELAKKQYLIRHDKMGSGFTGNYVGSMEFNVKTSGIIMFLALCALLKMAILSYIGIRRST